MSKIIKYKSTNGNDREYVISRSISRPKKFWNLEVRKQGKKEFFESGYSTIKMARNRISYLQLS